MRPTLVASWVLLAACSSDRDATIAIFCDCVQPDGGVTVWQTFPLGSGIVCTTHDEAVQQCPKVLARVPADAGTVSSLNCTPVPNTCRCDVGADPTDCYD